MKKLLWPVLFLSFALISCNDDDEKDDACTAVNYGDTLEIEAGNTYCLPDDIQLEVVALKNEFCPCEAVCVWEGQMTIDMTWTFADGSIQAYRHNAGAEQVNETLPDSMTVSADQNSIVFEEECDASNPSPEILTTEIVINK